MGWGGGLEGSEWSLVREGSRRYIMKGFRS